MSYDHYTPPEPTRSQLEQRVEELEAEVAEAKEQRLTFIALHDAVDELSVDDQGMAHRLLGALHLHAIRGEWAETPADTAQAMMLAARREVEQLRAELAECEASRGRLQVALRETGVQLTEHRDVLLQWARWCLSVDANGELLEEVTGLMGPWMAEVLGGKTDG